MAKGTPCSRRCTALWRHTSYHVGQIAYLSRLLTTEGWKWITIPPGQSEQYNAAGGKYLKRGEDVHKVP